ncbi:MAG TPA: DUF2190 family protein [bacterium]|nr:DUF2190 family protein [bacterium]
MTTKFVQTGVILDYENSGSAIESGDVVVIGDQIGVAIDDIAATTGEGAVRMEGVFELAKNSGEAFAVGDKLFWDADPGELTKVSSGNTPAGICFKAADEADVVANVKLGGAKDFSPSDLGEMVPADEVAALIDNSGGATADGTIGVVTAPTELTDNGGGTADGIVAVQAAPTTLTDNSGGSGTHDDTLAEVTVPTLAGWNGSTNPSAAEATEIITACTALKQNQSDVAQKVIELVTLAGVAQDNLKELTTAQGQDRTAIVALTDAVKELSTKVNVILSAMKSANLMASS